MSVRAVAIRANGFQDWRLRRRIFFLRPVRVLAMCFPRRRAAVASLACVVASLACCGTAYSVVWMLWVASTAAFAECGR